MSLIVFVVATLLLTSQSATGAGALFSATVSAAAIIEGAAKNATAEAIENQAASKSLSALSKQKAEGDHEEDSLATVGVVAAAPCFIHRVLRKHVSFRTLHATVQRSSDALRKAASSAAQGPTTTSPERARCSPSVTSLLKDLSRHAGQYDKDAACFLRVRSTGCAVVDRALDDWRQWCDELAAVVDSVRRIELQCASSEATAADRVWRTLLAQLADAAHLPGPNWASDGSECWRSILSEGCDSKANVDGGNSR